MKQFRFIPDLMAVAWMTAADVRLASAQEVTVGDPLVEKIERDRDRDHRRRHERPERRDRPERPARPERPVRR